LSKTTRPQIIRPRIRLGETVLIGPGKIELLRAVAEHGSISAAARALGIGYKRAWSLLDELQRSIPVPIVETAAGGSKGGGAQVTAAGHALLKHYDELDAACRQAAEPALKKLDRLLRR
jgi:molybdate transport system regulatory protein